MTKRERLHWVVDQLPESELGAAERFLEYLRVAAADPVLRALLTAPDDDEPESDEERAAVSEAYEDIKAGRVYSLDEVKHELGL